MSLNIYHQTKLSNILRGDISGGMYQDKLYRIPFRSDAGMLYYRQDLLTQAGYEPPETFSDLITISQDLQQQVSRLGLCMAG